MATVQEIMQDAPASVDTTYTISVGDSFEGTIEYNSDEDWVRVELVAGRSYDIRLDGVRSGGLIDPVLSIYNSAGEEVAFNDNIDDDAGLLDSMLEFTPDTTGVYYISSSSFAAGLGDYVLMVVDEEEDDNSGTPYAVSPGSSLPGSRFNGSLDDKYDEDWVRVELSGGEMYVITLGGTGPDVDMDTVLRVYNSAGEQVGINDDVDFAAGKLNSSLTFTPTATGTYYISAGTNKDDQTQDNSGRYQLAVYNELQIGGLFLTGTVGDDVVKNALVGGPGNDDLQGRGGNDWLEGGAGADVISGGSGRDDFALYLYSDAGVEVNLHAMTARGGHAEGDIFVSGGTIMYVDAEGVTREAQVPDIEHLTGSAYDDILVGSHGDNELSGYYGDDELDGQGGTDYLAGGPGADRLIGGSGADTAVYWYSDAGVVVRLHSGMARGGHAEGDTFPGTEMVEHTDSEGNTRTVELPDIEHLIGSRHDDILAGDLRDNGLEGLSGNDILYGGPDGGNDVLFGNTGDDKLYGGKGKDFLRGGPDNDLLSGGEGNDVLNGEGGADMLIGGSGEDTVSYELSDSGVTIRLHSGIARGGHAEGDTFAGTETVEHVDSDGNTQTVELPDIENLVGSWHDDILAGDLRDNRLEGFPGNDTLYGGPGGGDDILYGVTGHDRLYGGKGNDYLDGGADNDRLYGGIGNDILNGGADNDLLYGGPDDDTLIGSYGDDIFFFAPGGGADTVRDFGFGDDKIDLTAFADIRSMEDLVLAQAQQGFALVIDLSGQGGGTVTLEDVTEAEQLTDDHFIF